MKEGVNAHFPTVVPRRKHQTPVGYTVSHDAVKHGVRKGVVAKRKKGAGSLFVS